VEIHPARPARKKPGFCAKVKANIRFQESFGRCDDENGTRGKGLPPPMSSSTCPAAVTLVVDSKVSLEFAYTDYLQCRFPKTCASPR